MSSPDPAPLAPQPSDEGAAAAPAKSSSGDAGGQALVVSNDPPAYTLRTEADEEADRSKIQNLKYLNAGAFLLSAVFVVGVVVFGAREMGVFGDPYLWMRYQTLVTPADYVNLIWVPLFLLQGAFVWASVLHPALQRSPLVGYDAALSEPKRSVAAHYPAVCAATLLTAHFHDRGSILPALLFSLAAAWLLSKILGVQGAVVSEVGEGEADNDRARALRYAALRLPFELLAGHVAALVALYLNTFVVVSFRGLPAAAYLSFAWAGLLGLAGVGFWALWKIPERKFYGVGAALLWYLLGVAVELHAPTQPIYNEFSDGAILSTQVLAGAATTLLATLLGVRVMKTLIKRDLFGCGGSVATEETEVGADYVHA